MVLGQARLTARLLLATIAGIALWSLLWFGPEHLLPPRIRGGVAAEPMAVWEAALRFPGVALLWSLIYEGAARVPRWRRNIVRAGNVFATTWISTMTLVLAMQVITLASAMGYAIDRGSAFATVIGVLLLFRANMLPKSRPAWFNGIALPIFASRADVWRRVHRASAVRVIGIALACFLLAAFAPEGMDPIQPIVLLLLAELVIASGHGLWLGSTTRAGEPVPSDA
jgi:uncharacterized membrane protein